MLHGFIILYIDNKQAPAILSHTLWASHAHALPYPKPYARPCPWILYSRTVLWIHPVKTGIASPPTARARTASPRQSPSKAPKRARKAHKMRGQGQGIGHTPKARQSPLNRLLYPRHTCAPPALTARQERGISAPAPAHALRPGPWPRSVRTREGIRGRRCA